MMPLYILCLKMYLFIEEFTHLFAKHKLLKIFSKICLLIVYVYVQPNIHTYIALKPFMSYLYVYTISQEFALKRNFMNCENL